MIKLAQYCYNQYSWYSSNKACDYFKVTLKLGLKVWNVFLDDRNVEFVFLIYNFNNISI